ncbi:hypothetical protein P1P75_11865 [Streptomyces sp. ID05-39B]|uniref:hypothetical protein n=1 Tax=Streptomyces sp. ID05-39B TaxID=3028664 RepID=UPI0029A7B3A8|nr:hypothetical protein [Streptomyces sp. ID05-39B]MDX3527120.1 hypothetical protein [Streptomyces sp. ID05-39B]
MSHPRVNEARAILRANSPETPDLATPIRAAFDRQAAELREQREPEHVVRDETAAQVGDGLDRLFRRLGPPADRAPDSEEYDRG